MWYNLNRSQPNIDVFEDKGRSHKPEYEQFLEAEKFKETDSGIGPCKKNPANTNDSHSI